MSNSLSFYFHHQAFLPSMALSLLYLTVLNFSGQMITYLVSIGYSSTQIGIIRTFSVIFEMSATWLAPMAASRVGPIRAGLWFINWQLGWILVAVILFLNVPSPIFAASGLAAGVILSRLGLWGFDLCAQMIIQRVSALHVFRSKVRLIEFFRRSNHKTGESSPHWKCRSRTPSSSARMR
jgi:solute carrier family 40 (iron-regulated transporter), member 1